MSPMPSTPSRAIADSTDRPLVVACVRITDLRPEVDLLTGSVRRDRWGLGLSAADAAALEHALRVAESWSGRVAVVTAAPISADPVLLDAVALGATVMRLDAGTESDSDYPGALAADERALAISVAAALTPLGPPALVVCGDGSADRGTGAFPAYLAHELGAAQALGLVTLTPQDGSVVVERRLDGGWRERLRVPCPAVCSVEGAGVRLRRAPLAASLATAQQPVTVVGHEPAEGHGGVTGTGPDGAMVAGAVHPFRPRTRVLPAPTEHEPRLRLLALTGALEDRDPPTVVGPTDASGAADALIAYLVRHGYLDGPRDRDRPAAGTDSGGDRS